MVLRENRNVIRVLVQWRKSNRSGRPLAGERRDKRPLNKWAKPMKIRLPACRFAATRSRKRPLSPHPLLTTIQNSHWWFQQEITLPFAVESKPDCHILTSSSICRLYNNLNAPHVKSWNKFFRFIVKWPVMTAWPCTSQKRLEVKWNPRMIRHRKSRVSIFMIIFTN